MIKHIALLVVILTLGLSASALAAEAGSGIIEGQIINGTAGGSSVADQEIILKTYLNEAEVDSTTTQTDADGRFVFAGLSTESGYDYEVTLFFQEAEYNSEWLRFDEGETTKSVELNVYDSTTSDEAIKVVTAHTILYVEQGSLWAEEYFLFVNDSDRTYVGSEGAAADGQRMALRFSLPKEATELQYGLELMQCCIIGSEDGFIDTMPVLPGNKEIFYGYKIDYNSGIYDFSHRVNYPTVNFDLLIQGESTEVASEQLTTAEPLNIGGIWFNHLSGTDFAPGSVSVIQISGLPRTANSQDAILWVVLALVVLIGGFGLSYLIRKRRLQPVSPEDSLGQRKQELLVELARLDDDFEGGKIPEDVYRRLRVERKTQLVELMKGSEEKRREAGDNGKN